MASVVISVTVSDGMAGTTPPPFGRCFSFAERRHQIVEMGTGVTPGTNLLLFFSHVGGTNLTSQRTVEH